MYQLYSLSKQEQWSSPNTRGQPGHSRLNFPAAIKRGDTAGFKLYQIHLTGNKWESQILNQLGKWAFYPVSRFLVRFDKFLWIRKMLRIFTIKYILSLQIWPQIMYSEHVHFTDICHQPCPDHATPFCWTVSQAATSGLGVGINSYLMICPCLFLRDTVYSAEWHFSYQFGFFF